MEVVNTWKNGQINIDRRSAKLIPKVLFIKF